MLSHLRVGYWNSYTFFHLFGYQDFFRIQSEGSQLNSRVGSRLHVKEGDAFNQLKKQMPCLCAQVFDVSELATTPTINLPHTLVICLCSTRTRLQLPLLFVGFWGYSEAGWIRGMQDTVQNRVCARTLLMCTHTHLLQAHFSAQNTWTFFVCVHFAHFRACRTHTHGSRSWRRCLLHDFETNLTDALVHTFLPNFPDPKARVKRTPHEDEQFGNLAKSVLLTGYEPKEFDKVTSVDNDTTLIDDPDLHQISDFSKNTHENTRHFGVPTVFESSVLHVSQWWSCSSERKQRKHAIGKPLQDQREREKEKVLWSVLQSRCQWKVDGTVLVWVYGLTKNSFLMNEISENTLNEELNKQCLVENSVQRKLCSTEYDEEIQNLERRNSEHALFESQRELESQRQRLLEDTQWTDQVQRERKICVSNWRWRIVFTRIATQEVAKNLKNCTVSLLRDQVRRLQELLEFTEDSKIFYDPDSPSSYDSAYVPHQALVTLEFKKA